MYIMWTIKYICVCVYACVDVCIWMYVYMYVCVYVYVFIYIYWYFSTNIFLLFDRSDKISNSFSFNSFIRLIVSYSPYMHNICN